MAPIDGIRFVHAAIVNEARDIEQRAHAATSPEEVGGLVDRLGDESALERIRRQTVALTDQGERHVRKENELVLPVSRESFSDDEQSEMVSTMLSAFSPEVMARAASWIVSNVDADTGAEYLSELAAVMPSPAFEGTKTSIRDTVGPQRWSELVQRVPSLA